MRNIQIVGKTAIVLAAFVASVGLAQEPAESTAASVPSASVTAKNEITLAQNDPIELTPSVEAADSDGSTTINYETNDGLTYVIQAVADDWTFSNDTSGASAGSVYPELTITETTADDPVELISSGNVGTSVDVVAGIKNVDSSASITLGASVTQEVVAGTYTSSITYSLVTE